MHKLKMQLSKYGTIQIIKEGVVFILLMTGDKLDNSTTWIAIQKLVNDYCKDKYKLVEAMRNEESFFCMVLK